MKWNDFVLTLTATSQVAANLLRLEFEVGGGTADGYVPIAPGDEAIAFYFSPDGDELVARQSDDPKALGGWEIADPERSAGHRNYTVRAYDPQTRRMLVDVAEHGHGPAIDWFRAARPGGGCWPPGRGPGTSRPLTPPAMSSRATSPRCPRSPGSWRRPPRASTSL
ncbi:siderophore-interacting protein [Tsukamurella sp. PLM1]|uniref:siderophore-interacting protein n=1 Tax=Tsukamurella sp. PLM1 TaxID=2929795 RepID=UPI00206223C2|nr:siderophore-interacting protein [Tsukamurella sp. PLM1]BDH59217.1 hypothetical protein MTP03_41560 [Tsukamurella sp. PLM1]